MILPALGALALLSLAAQAPAAPPVPPWPLGVEVRERAELPFVTAALGVPLDQPPALLPLVAAWLSQPESFPEGPVATLRAAGGRLRARAAPGGLVVIAEGPAAREGEVAAAALALLSSSPDPAGIEPARAAALSTAASEEDQEAWRRGLWAVWYGEEAARQRAPLSERAALEATREALQKALLEVQARSSGHRLFLEGPVRRAALPAEIAQLRVTWAPMGPPSLPRPTSSGEGATSAAETPREGLLVVGHPLAPGAWSPVLERAFARALERRLAPLGRARVRVEQGRHARLLVIELLPLGDAQHDAYGALTEALVAAREEAGGDRGLAADLEAARADLAREDARLGSWAERRAGEHLVAPARAPVGGEQEALVGLLRISVLPEILRRAPPPQKRQAQEARPPKARSAAWAKDRG